MFRIFYLIQEDLKEVYLLSVKHKDECDSYMRKGFFKDFKEF